MKASLSCGLPSLTRMLSSRCPETLFELFIRYLSKLRSHSGFIQFKFYMRKYYYWSLQNLNSCSHTEHDGMETRESSLPNRFTKHLWMSNEKLVRRGCLKNRKLCLPYLVLGRILFLVLINLIWSFNQMLASCNVIAVR